MEEIIYRGSYEEYVDAAEVLANEKQLPVLVQPPCRNMLFVLPINTGEPAQTTR